MITITRNEDLAWAAGFYDGEGSTTIHRKGKHAYPRCTVAQKHTGVLEKFQRIVGCGTISFKEATATHNECHYWQARSHAETEMVIGLLWPWLGTQKREQAERRLAASTWHNGSKDKLKCSDPTHIIVPRSEGSGRRCKTCRDIYMESYRDKMRTGRVL